MSEAAATPLPAPISPEELKLAFKALVVVGGLLLYGVCLVAAWTISEVWMVLTSRSAETVPVVAKQAPVILADARLFVRTMNKQAKQEALR